MVITAAMNKPAAPPCVASFHLELYKAGIDIDAEKSMIASNIKYTERFTLFFIGPIYTFYLKIPYFCNL